MVEKMLLKKIVQVIKKKHTKFEQSRSIWSELFLGEIFFEKKLGGGDFQDTVEKNLGNVTMNQHAKFEQNRSMGSVIEKFFSKKQGFLDFFKGGKQNF